MVTDFMVYSFGAVNGMIFAVLFIREIIYG